MSLYRGLRGAQVDRRCRALESFASWEARHGERPSARVALEGVGFLWELLPREARERPVDPSGVRRMHAILGHLRSAS